MANEGHNSSAAPADVGGITAEQLKSYIERVERLNEEIAGLNADKRDIFAEAKANGFDVKVMKEIVRIRKMDADDRREQETLLDVYMHALGMASGDLPDFDPPGGAA